MASSGGESILACDGVSKYYGAMAAVDQLSFEVNQGEVLGIGGPNGAGKTTLFDVISGLSPADTGRIVFNGKDITGRRHYTICHAGLSRTFQLNAAFESISIRENILCAAYYGPRNVFFPKLGFDKAAKRIADEVIEFVGLKDVQNEVAGTVPVLHRKLLMIASALATKPKLLLLDEPVGGLNHDEIDAVMRLVRSLKHERSVTVVLIEHVMRFLVALSDRVLIMHHGQKIYEGSPEGLPKDRTVVEVYLGKGTAERLQHVIEEERAHGAA